MAGFSEYNVPGTGGGTTGYVLNFRSRNYSRGIDAQFTLYGTMGEADLQEIVEALAGIPGASYVLVTEGAVSQREMIPTREYEPLPVPPQD